MEQAIYRLMHRSTSMNGVTISTVSIVFLMVALGISMVAPWAMEGGASAIPPLVSAGILGALGLAFWRRTKLIEKQSKVLRLQGEEIELAYSVLNAHALVCMTDNTGRVTWANDKFLTTYGYSSDELVGTSISRIYPHGEKDRIFNEIGTTLSRGKIWSGDMNEVTASGETVHMRCTVVPLIAENGRHKRSVAIRTDNSDHHRAAKAYYLKDVFDHLQDEVYVYDAASYGIVYANLAAIKNTDLKPESLHDSTILDADPFLDEKSLKAHLAPLVNENRHVVHVNVKRGDVPYEITSHRYVGENGRPIFMSLIRDTTERHKTEKAKMESVSVVSHELRTPLTSIKGAMRLLQSGALGTFEEKAKTTLDIAVRNTDRLLMVVDDILDLEKIRAGKMEINPETVNLVSFLEDLIEMNVGYANEHGVTFAFSTDTDRAMASISADRMGQVIANLLSNAAKYSPKGGTVQIGLERDDDRWRISVSDDGPGIPEEHHEDVFASFAQIASIDGKVRKGTGLGLTISQKIVEAHGGKIDFVSQVHKGTTFFVWLDDIEDA